MINIIDLYKFYLRRTHDLFGRRREGELQKKIGGIKEKGGGGERKGGEKMQVGMAQRKGCEVFFIAAEIIYWQTG